MASFYGLWSAIVAVLFTLSMLQAKETAAMLVSHRALQYCVHLPVVFLHVIILKILAAAARMLGVRSERCPACGLT